MFKHDAHIIYTDLLTPDANRSWHYPRLPNDTHSGIRHKNRYIIVQELSQPYEPSPCWDYYDIPASCPAIKLQKTIKWNL